MDYNDVQKRVDSQISSLAGQVGKEGTSTTQRSNEEILNMIALEIKRKGG